MKFFLLLLLALFSSGCMSSGLQYKKADPNQFSMKGWNGGQIMTKGRELGAGRFTVEVVGAGACTKEQVLEEANRVAAELAEGKKFSTQFETVPYNYTSSGGGMVFRHSGFKVIGSIEVSQ